MQNLKKLLIVFLGGLLLSSCATLTEHGKYYSSAQNYYKSGNYYDAVRACVLSLRNKPAYKEAIELLHQVAPLAYDDHLKKAKEYEKKGNWDEAVNEYDKISYLTTEVSSLKGNFPVIDITKEKGIASNNAAASHYQMGLSLMKQGKNKEAAKEFSKCKEFIPNYKDSLSLYEKCRKDAVQRVAIIPFENVTGKMWFQDVGALLTDQVLGNCFKAKLEFAEFVTRDYLTQLFAERKIQTFETINQGNAVKIGKIASINYFIFGKVNSIVTDYPPLKRRTEKLDGRETEGEGENKKTVNISGEVTIYTKEGKVEVRGSYQIIDVKTGTIAKSNSIVKEKKDKVEWAEYTGDERIMKYYKNREYAKLISQGEGDPQPSEVLINRATEDLSKDIADEIVNFFK